MNEYTTTIKCLYNNRTAREWITIFILLISISIIYSSFEEKNLKGTEFYIVLLYSIVCTIYIIYNFYKIIYQLTSLEEYNEEIPFWDFFWTFGKFQSNLSLILLLPISFVIIIEILNNPPKIEFQISLLKYLRIPIVFNLAEFFIFTYSIFSIIFIGTRNFKNAFSKLGSLLSSKKIITFLLIFLILTTLFLFSISLQFSNIAINLFIKSVSILLCILSYITFLVTIRYWQKKLYEKKIKLAI